MGNSVVEDYNSDMRELIYEYKNLDGDERKKRFTEYVKKEADIFAKVIDGVNVSNISRDDYNSLLNKRTEYIKELFDSKDTCLIF